MVFFQQTSLFDARCPLGEECQSDPCIFNHQTKLDGLPSDSLLQRLAERKPTATVAKAECKLEPERPKIKVAMNMKFSWQLRQNFLDKFFDILTTYHPEPFKQAFREEAAIYHQCKQSSVYRSVGLARIKSLQAEAAKAKEEEKKAAPLVYDHAILESLLLRESQRAKFPDKLEFTAAPLPAELPCARCKTPFDPRQPKGKCRFHHGRLFRPNRNERVYSCCHGTDMAKPCCTEEHHVFTVEQSFGGEGGLFELESVASAPKIVAMDGEMIHTERGMELARLSIVDWDLNCLLDAWVKPSSFVIDYNTRFSGVRPEHMELAIGMEELRSKLKALLSRDSIIVGHSVDNDLWSLGLVHHRIIDTAELFREGKSHTPGLRALTRTHLHERIQEGSDGHDSVEDARTTMRLLQHRLK